MRKRTWENGAGLRQLEECSFLKGRIARPESWRLIWMDVEDDVGAGPSLRPEPAVWPCAKTLPSPGPRCLIGETKTG